MRCHLYSNQKVIIVLSLVVLLQVSIWVTLENTCLMGNFACFFVFADLFSKSTFLNNSFRNMIRVSNSLDPDQAQQNVGPDLGPNCLQMLSADATSRHRVSNNHDQIMRFICCFIGESSKLAFEIKISNLAGWLQKWIV